MLTANSSVEAEMYGTEFASLWATIAGLPNLPTIATGAGMSLARKIEDIPRETREAAVAAIDAVWRSRCVGTDCGF